MVRLGALDLHGQAIVVSKFRMRLRLLGSFGCRSGFVGSMRIAATEPAARNIQAPASTSSMRSASHGWKRSGRCFENGSHLSHSHCSSATALLLQLYRDRCG